MSKNGPKVTGWEKSTCVQEGQEMEVKKQWGTETLGDLCKGERWDGGTQDK